VSRSVAEIERSLEYAALKHAEYGERELLQAASTLRDSSSLVTATKALVIVTALLVLPTFGLVFFEYLGWIAH
jgi:hypothetical protein